MKRYRLIILLSIIAIGTQCYAMSKPDTPLQSIRDDLKLLEIWVNAQQEYRNIPGISIGLVYDQELVYTQNFGYSDIAKKTSLTNDVPFRIASITKTFTATALMQLRDAGKLRLDDPVKDYLTWFNIPQRFSDQPPITIRQLLTHTSGLPCEADFPYWTDHNFPTMDQIKATLSNQETIYPPATQIKYSNLGMSLAGEIVAVVSGQSYENYITSHIFEPLGMTGSSVLPDHDYQQLLVSPYSRRQDNATHDKEEYTETNGIASAASIASTIDDLASYVSLQFREDDNTPSAVLKGSSLREMHRVQFLKPNWSSGRGLGWSVWQRNGKTVNGHSGWVGGNRTGIMFIPEEKVAVIVLTNSDDGEPNFFGRYILDHMGPVLVEAFAPPKPAVDFDPAWKKYVGTYVKPGPYYTDVLIMGQKLVMSTLGFPPENNPGSEVIELSPEGKDTFRMVGSNGNGELVIFQYDGMGSISEVKVGSNFIYPIALYTGRR